MYASAIARLKISKDNCLHNAPIRETEGDFEQAKLDRANAEAYRLAIEALRAA